MSSQADLSYIKHRSQTLAELGRGNLRRMATRSNPKTAPPSSVAASIVAPVVTGVVSCAFDNTANPGPPLKSTAPQYPVFPNQANPRPIKLGSGDATVYLNSGHFARNNPCTRSVAGGGASVTLSADAFPEEYWSNVETLETMMRGICINAVQSMKGIDFETTPAPAVMGVLLALNEVKDGERTVGKGWQIYIHSSVRGVPCGGPQAQALIHPTLKKRVEKAGIVHHFSSMCAEMGLLSNFLYDNPNILGLTGRLESCGEPVYMMTYNAGNFPLKPGETSPRDGTGYYLVPCRHSLKRCGHRRNHFGTHGCSDVLRGLGVQDIGRGQPSEQDRAVLAEQTARENEAAGGIAGPSAVPQAATVPGANARAPVTTNQRPNISRTPVKSAVK